MWAVIENDWGARSEEDTVANENIFYQSSATPVLKWCARHLVRWKRHYRTTNCVSSKKCCQQRGWFLSTNNCATKEENFFIRRAKSSLRIRFIQTLDFTHRLINSIYTWSSRGVIELINETSKNCLKRNHLPPPGEQRRIPHPHTSTCTYCINRISKTLVRCTTSFHSVKKNRRREFNK